MAQFDVHRTTGSQKVIPFVVVVQSRRFDVSRRRVVVPLVLASSQSVADPVLNPTFDVDGRKVMLHALHIISVDVDRLGERVASLKAEGDRVIAAIDALITRAWD